MPRVLSGPGLRQDLVEDVDIMHFAVGNTDERGNIAVQVEPYRVIAGCTKAPSAETQAVGVS
jgi:hypothetical protein